MKFRTLKNGLITEDEIDVSVARVLKARFDLGMFDPDESVKWASIPYEVVDCEKHRAQALKVARESMTLLKNENNVLPLSKNLKKIAVLGRNANDEYMMWGNYNGIPSETITILEGIQAKLPNVEIVYDPGCDLVKGTYSNSLMDCFVSNGKQGMSSSYFANTHFQGASVCEQDGLMHFSFTTNGGTHFAPNVPLSNFSARYVGTFTAPYTGEINFFLKADDTYCLRINGDIVLEANDYTLANSRAQYTRKVTKGEILEVVLEYRQYGGGASLDFAVNDEEKLISFETLKQKIADVDAIIYVGGLSPRLEGEEMPVDADGFRGGDRLRIELPDVQSRFLKELHTLGKPLVFVLCTGSAVGLERDESNYDALLNAWYPGQAGGTAVADVIFGDYNPAGRLPVTFYRSTRDLPDFENYDMANRTYRYFEGTPLYAFGYGLSYTKFAYRNAKVSFDDQQEELHVEFDLENCGNRDGEEVAQVYIQYLEDKSTPRKSLVGFSRIPLKTKEIKRIKMTIDGSNLKTFNSAENKMERRPGRYAVYYGGSSRIEDLKQIVLTLK